MKSVVAHIERLVLKGVRVEDPASFVVAIQAELGHALGSCSPAEIARSGAQALRTKPVRLPRGAGDKLTASRVARGVAEALGS